MALPGFTAEASVGPTTGTYRVQNYYGIAGAALSPQQFEGDMDFDDSEVPVDMEESTEDMEDTTEGTLVGDEV